VCNGPSIACEKGIIEVPIDSIDSFCAQKKIDQIDLLKIDTEGHEMCVLKGAEKLLSEKRIDFVLSECEFFRREEEPHGDFTSISNYLGSFDLRSGVLLHRGYRRSRLGMGGCAFSRMF